MFKRQRRDANPMTPEEYHQRALEVIRTHLPAEHFEATDDLLVFANGKVTLGLHNLYSIYIRDRLSPSERDDAIRERATTVVRESAVSSELMDLPWTEVQKMLRPQLMPSHFSQLLPVVTVPFDDDVSIGIVVDSDSSYAYVPDAVRQQWGLSHAALLAAAVENLDVASAGIELRLSEEPERVLTIEMDDGYDAARILIPGIRAIAVEHLGEPCYAAVPTRDFLIFWSTGNDSASQASIRDEIRHYFETQPYALTSSVFSVTRDSVIPSEDA